MGGAASAPETPRALRMVMLTIRGIAPACNATPQCGHACGHAAAVWSIVAGKTDALGV